MNEKNEKNEKHENDLPELLRDFLAAHGDHSADITPVVPQSKVVAMMMTPALAGLFTEWLGHSPHEVLHVERGPGELTHAWDHGTPKTHIVVEVMYR